jgi:hypothetical protein
MGLPDAARVDTVALLGIAQRYDTLAALLDDAGRSAHGTFDGATAGQAYTARGDALRSGVDATTDGLRAWSRAAAEIASAMRGSAYRYGQADARAAGRL